MLRSPCYLILSTKLAQCPTCTSVPGEEQGGPVVVLHCPLLGHLSPAQLDLVLVLSRFRFKKGEKGKVSTRLPPFSLFILLPLWMFAAENEMSCQAASNTTSPGRAQSVIHDEVSHFLSMLAFINPGLVVLSLVSHVVSCIVSLQSSVDPTLDSMSILISISETPWCESHCQLGCQCSLLLPISRPKADRCASVASG